MTKRKSNEIPPNTLCKYILVMIIGGIFGFIYEEFFYYIDLGVIVKRGTSFGPWVPIYGFGAMLLLLLNKKIKKKPVLVFFNSLIICSLLELVAGYCLTHYLDLTLWNYNTEIWNWGNIGGYVCLRSALFFGFSGLFLAYIIEPLTIKIINKYEGRALEITCIITGLIYFGDIIASLFLKIL